MPDLRAATGIEQCAPCHREIAESFAKTGMARSLYRVRPEVMGEDFRTKNRFRHDLSEREYAMVERGGRYFQRRWQKGAVGPEINVIEKEIHYVLGSGNHSRAYLSLTPQGQLIQLPVGWYAESGGEWGMSPGYDRPDHMDFRRKIDKECFFCHNAYPEASSVLPGTGRELIFRGAPPTGIDCQRCHGPGEQHTRAAGSGKPLDEVRKAIVNPARLSNERQLEVCFQCHLESTSHSLPYSLRRYGRDYFSYKAGEPLSGYILHFDHAPGSGREDKFEISHSAYRLMQSACFLRREGKLTCTRCHDPHAPSTGALATARYTRACQGCHAVPPIREHQGVRECAGCHMPKRRTEDAVHVVMTDHRIQRRPRGTGLLAPVTEVHDSPGNSYRGEVVPLYPRLPRAEDALYVAVAQVTDGSNVEAGIGRLERLIREQQPVLGEFYLELGKAYQRVGQHDEALQWLREARRRDASLVDASLHESFSLLRLGRPREPEETLRKAIAFAPWNAALLNAAGVAFTQAGEVRKAVEMLKRAEALDPDLPETFLNLGFAYFQGNQRTAAETALRSAIGLAPDLAPAHSNLAVLLNLKGDLDGAKFHFERALRFDGRNAEAAVSLGLLLLREGNAIRAGELFESALQIKPAMMAARFNLGLALLRQSKAVEALPHFEAAVAANPEDHEAHLHIGTILEQMGRVDEAVPHLRKAASSPDGPIRAAAEALLRRIAR